MADTGWKIAGSVANVARSSPVQSYDPWTNPQGITNYSDEDRAKDSGNSSPTYYLYASNFGFSIPEDATILGVEARVRREGKGINSDFYLTPGGVISGNNMAVPGAPGKDIFVDIVYGSSTDLWGTSLTPAIVQNSNFGVQYAADATSKRYISVSYIELKVHYEAPGSFYEKVAGVWRKGQLYERVAGVYRPGKLYERIGGIWRS